MSASLVKRIAAVVGAAAALGAAAPGAAQADHTNALALCNQKYTGGNFTHYGRVPIQTDSGNALGWVALAYRGAAGNSIQWCAVTVRRYHGEARYTSVRIKRESDAEWRDDSNQYFEYAGPVMRALDYDVAGQCLVVRGQITDEIVQFRICNNVVEV